LFNKSIIESDDICLIGIGAILNDRELSRVDHYKQKVVFSSGVGYGDLDMFRFDSSWEFACVRGPGSARALGLCPEKAIADGAILLADVQEN
jgi:succinoglycan biosynthesis protein ExoV